MKTWMVTGASSGFGKTITAEALRRGDRVAATVRDTATLDALAQAHPQTLLPVLMEVTDPESVETVVSRTRDWAGGIDVLVNNAGYGLHGAIEEVSHEEMLHQYDVNVFGLMRVTRAVLPIMRARGHGHVVNISSIGGLLSNPGSGVYCSTKHAVEGLTEALRQELEPLGITALLVEPGPFRTDFGGRSIKISAQAIAGYEETAGARAASLRGNSGKQPGDPERAAGIICDLVEMDDPPFRLLLGNAAVDRAKQKLHAMVENIERWEKLSRSADYA